MTPMTRTEKDWSMGDSAGAPLTRRPGRSNGAMRLKCAELAPAAVLAGPRESASKLSKLDALQTLRAFVHRSASSERGASLKRSFWSVLALHRPPKLRRRSALLARSETWRLD